MIVVDEKLEYGKEREEETGRTNDWSRDQFPLPKSHIRWSLLVHLFH
jgi:hypothetical protein